MTARDLSLFYVMVRRPVCEVAFDNFFIKEFYDDDDRPAYFVGLYRIIGVKLLQKPRRL